MLTDQKRSGKQARSRSSPMVSTQLESITEHPQESNDDHDTKATQDTDASNSAVETTAIDYKSVLSQWEGRSHEPEEGRKPRLSFRRSLRRLSNSKTPSTKSVTSTEKANKDDDLAPKDDKAPVEDSITERRSEVNLPQERSESPSSQSRLGVVDSPLPTKSFEDYHASLQETEVSKIEPTIQNEASKIESSIPDEVSRMEPTVQKDVLKIDTCVNSITSPPSPVSVVDEGCNMPLHPAEQSAMVMLLKPTASTPLGIRLACYGWRIVISHIEETSLLFQSELQEGQTILAVNGMAASDFESPQAMLDALQVSRKVVIVATKSILYSTTESLGLVLGKTSWNTLYISQLLVPNSTLRTGMTVIAINRTTELDLRTANRLLQEHQMGQTVRLSILALPTPPSSADASSSMTLFCDETCVTAQLLPSCSIELRKHEDWRITIASIQNHPKLRVGQTVLAVNGVPAYCFGSAEAMKEMVGWSPALIFATNSILASVVKPNADTKVGVAFRLSKGCLRIHQVDPEGLFSGKLKEGMKVIGINGNPCPRRLEAANVMVKDCVGTLTIVAVDDVK
jgi:hypothetical protein